MRKTQLALLAVNMVEHGCPTRLIMEVTQSLSSHSERVFKKWLDPALNACRLVNPRYEIR
jgi:hypothetical protein